MTGGSKTIIVLSGSNNDNGNTSYLINKVFPDCKVIKLSEQNIKPCYGCNQCKNGKCIIDDDFSSIIHSLENKFILISPIFFLGFPSYVKAFIDRFQMYWESGKREDFDFAAIILHGERGNYKAEEGLKFLSKLIFEILGAKKNFFHVLHKFQPFKNASAENDIICMTKKLQAVYSVK